MGKKDYYETLNVQKGASDEEIKKSYRKLAKQYHPDVNPDDKASEEKFKEINEAYEVLSDSDKKQKYDQFGHAGVDPSYGAGAGAGGGGYGGNGGGFGGDFSDFGDIFESMFGGSFGGFGGSSRRNGPSRGEDLEIMLTLTFEEAVFGTTKDISYTKVATCDDCKGSGAAKGTDAETCPTCRGSGQVKSVQRTMLGNIATSRPCDNCRGTGKIIKNPCGNCSGTGFVRKSVKKTVNIPAGIDEGQTVSMRGEGNSGKKGGPSGDLFIHIKVKPHKLFVRDGFNIKCEIPITFSQAVLGAEIEVPTIDGNVSYFIPEGTQTGSVFRFKNRGVQHINKSTRGDQYVTVIIDVPKNLNAEQKRKLREFAEITGTDNHLKQKGFFEKVKAIFD